MDIWKINLQLLQERNKALDVDEKAILRFAKDHYKHNVLSNSVWSGRQIQNAFKVATALAEWDNRTSPSLHNEHNVRPKLLPHHFAVIAHGTEAFDRYLREAVGYTDAERAYNDMVRADEHEYESVAPRASHDFDPVPPTALPVHSHRRSSHNLGLYRSQETIIGYGRAAQHESSGNRAPILWQQQSSPSLQPTAAQPRRRRQSNMAASAHDLLDAHTSSPRLEGPAMQQIHQAESPVQRTAGQTLDAYDESGSEGTESDVDPGEQLSNSRYLEARDPRISRYSNFSRT